MLISKAAAVIKKGKWKASKIKIPKIKKNEALIKVKYCGICSTDVVRSFGVGFYFYPIVPGHEIYGEVFEIKKNNAFKKNDRVAIYPLIPLCQKNTKAKCCGMKNHPNLCTSYDFLGSRSNGGYSQYLIAPIKNLIKINNKIDDKVAALIEPMSVSKHAINQVNLASSKNITILGLGPIGILIGLWCKFYKKKNVIGVDRNSHRFKSFKNLGYKNTINTNKNNEKFTKKNDVVFECSGSNELLCKGILSLNKRGSIVIVSNQISDVKFEKKVMDYIVRNEITIKGAWSSQIISKKNDWLDSIKVLGKFEKKIINLVTHIKRIDDCNKIFKDMYLKKFRFQKILIKP